jgi:hypothetical protein
MKNLIFGVFLLIPSLFAAIVEPGKESGPAKAAKLKEEPVLAVREGYYALRGHEKGNKYSGLVSVKAVGDRYLLSYLVAGQSYSALGSIHDDRFIVSWMSQGVLGTTVYRITETKLVGKWLGLPKGDGLEELFFKEPLEKEADDVRE